MSTDETIEQITDENFGQFLDAEHSALILTTSDCESYEAYERDILELVEQGELESARIGTMVLDEPGSEKFQNENPWIEAQEDFPYTLIYARGHNAAAFAASDGSELRDRLRTLSSTVESA